VVFTKVRGAESPLPPKLFRQVLSGSFLTGSPIDTEGLIFRCDAGFVIDFQNALGRLYIRYLDPSLG
jgi:hypothetical protein